MKYLERTEMLLKIGAISRTDYYFAEFIDRIGGKSDSPLSLLAALASCAYTCHHEIGVSEDILNDSVSLAKWLKLDKNTLAKMDGLFSSAWLPPEDDFLLSDGRRETPLVHANGMYYLHTMYKGMCSLVDFVSCRLTETIKEETPPDFTKITKLNLNAEQCEALRKALHSKFFIISGGPGTGKTTLLATLLALREEMKEDVCSVVLCAPTGKAQARMKEAINSELKNLILEDEALRERISDLPCSTIHRLLQYNPASGSFRYNRKNKLSCSLLIVDESSMISQSLMMNLFDALKDDASVILLGDKGQLASVEPGAVFADFMDILSSYPDHLAVLKRSIRFDPEQGIGRIKDILETEGEQGGEAWKCLNAKHPQLLYSPIPKQYDFEIFIKERLSYWSNADGVPWFRMNTLAKAWDLFENLRILSPVHEGLFGIRSLNEAVRKAYHFPNVSLCRGMAFLILKNSPELNVFNGDVGMAWPAVSPSEPYEFKTNTEETDLPLFVFFPDTDANGNRIWHGIQNILLPEYDDAYAISVHKSQGSGYSHILFFLPEIGGMYSESLFTKELLYTGITRAKKGTEVVTSEEVFTNASNRKTIRRSGLKKAFESAKK